MGFWNDIKKDFSDSLENGRILAEKQRRWKKEEAEYKNYSLDKLLTIDSIVQGINIGKLKVDKKQAELQLKYVKNNQKEKSDLQKAKNEISKEINKIKNGHTNIDDNGNEFDDFETNYRKAREKRVALCFNYLTHPKATEEGKRNAISVLLYSPYYRNVKMDIPNLKNRFSLYNKWETKKSELSVLELAFYSHIVLDCDIVVADSQLGEKWWEKNFKLQMNCRNTMEYNDETYGTHFRNLSFYGLSEKYTKNIKKMEDEFWKLIYQVCDENK